MCTLINRELYLERMEEKESEKGEIILNGLQMR